MVTAPNKQKLLPMIFMLTAFVTETKTVSSTTYRVGPSMPFTEISQVPWESLQPGGERTL